MKPLKDRPDDLAGAVGVLGEVFAAHRDDVLGFLDDGLTVVEHGRGRWKTWDVMCAACGARLVLTDNPDSGRALAARNAARNPCCDRWRADAR